MGGAGDEETAEFRVIDAPTHQLPALIPAMAHVSPDVAEHGSGLVRRWRWTLGALAAVALASIPLALFATSDGPSSQREQMPPLRWPPAAAAASGSPTPEPYPTEDPEAPPAVPPPAAEEAAPPPAGGDASATATPSPSPTPAPGSYEAEAPGNRLRGHATPRPVAGASGGKVVGWVGAGRDSTLTFTGVRAPRAGQYRVTIHYVTQDRRVAAVEVNDRRVAVVDFPPTGGWDRVGSTTVTLTLRAGENTIEFSNRYVWAPDFDRIVLPR